MRKPKPDSRKTTTASKKAKAPSRSRPASGSRRRPPTPARATSPVANPEPAPAATPAVAAGAGSPAGEPVVVVSEPIAVTMPEAVFAARVPPPESARPLPLVRRGIFFDVENSSRPEHVAAMLDHLGIEWTARATDLVAIGNWRVVSHETARLLAQRGAQLVHSAPSVGVRDWSDLRIAVAAGAWLAAARPGDSIEIISDDQAFDAVGDVAATLGVQFRRLSFRGLAGLGQVEAARPPAPAAATHQRPRRGRRRHGPAPPARLHVASPPPRRVEAPPPAPPLVAATDEAAHTAPADEIKQAVEDLLATSREGVTLDAVGNALKARGFRRTSGSPRLITRLRRLRGLEVTARGIVRLVEPARPEEPPGAAPAEVEVRGSDTDVGPGPDLEPGGPGFPVEASTEAGETAAGSRGDAPGDQETQPPPAREGGSRAIVPGRRRRRRGGRRWRGRGPAPASVPVSVAVVDPPRENS